MKVSGAADVHASPEAVRAALTDPGLLVGAVPGLDQIDFADDGACRFTLTASIAAVSGSYAGEARVVERPEAGVRVLRVSATGVKGKVGADVTVRLAPAGDGATEISYIADADVDGAIAGIGQRMLASIVRRLATDAIAGLDAALAAPAEAAPSGTDTGPAEAAAEPRQLRLRLPDALGDSAGGRDRAGAARDRAAPRSGCPRSAARRPRAGPGCSPAPPRQRPGSRSASSSASAAAGGDGSAVLVRRRGRSGRAEPLRLRVGIDTGGTFTDVVAYDEISGELAVTKTPTTPADPSIGFVDGLVKVLAQLGTDVSAVAAVSHGTTIATNQLLEGKIGRLGFITTEGFEFMLEIARQSVPDGYGNSYFWVKPDRIVPADLVRTVGGRSTTPAPNGGPSTRTARRPWRAGSAIAGSTRSASASCTPTPTPTMSSGWQPCWPGSTRPRSSRCHARCCASTASTSGR